jgi:hypothetical protein
MNLVVPFNKPLDRQERRGEAAQRRVLYIEPKDVLEEKSGKESISV